jgi:hypothetical protein
VSFDGAKVFGVRLDGAAFAGVLAGDVDISPHGDDSDRLSASAWVSRLTPLPAGSART